MSDRLVKSWSIETAAEPHVAFDYLADVARHGEWSPKPFRVAGVPDRPLQQGDSFRSIGWTPRDKEHVNEVEVTDLIDGERLELTSADDGHRYVNRFDVEGTDIGSRITRTVDGPKPSGVMKMLFPLIFVLFIRPEVVKGMRMLQSNLDEVDRTRGLQREG